MAIHTIKEPGGFWIPNAVIDLHFKELGSRGLALYCLVARCTTRHHYPGVGELSQRLSCPESKVIERLSLLHRLGLLNDSDLEAIVETDHAQMPGPRR